MRGSVERPLQQTAVLGLARRRLDAVARALVGEQAAGISPTTSSCQSAQEAGVGDLADDGVVQLPAVAERLHGREHLRPHDRDHPLLALGDHHLPGLHLLLTQRYLVEPEVDPALARHLGERGPTAPQSCSDSTSPDSTSSTETSISFLPMEGVADLHRRPLVGVVLAELLAREHGGAADPVPAGGGAVEDDEVAGPVAPARAIWSAGRSPTHIAFTSTLSGRPRRRRPRRRPGRRPSCMRRCRDGAVEAGVPGAKRRPSSSAIGLAPMAMTSRRMPPTPSRTLEGLDRRRVVVALDLEADRPRRRRGRSRRVLTGTLQDAFPLRGKAFQEEGRVLVAAVLRPESEKTASSKWFGSRPSRSTMRCSSPSVNPSAR